METMTAINKNLAALLLLLLFGMNCSAQMDTILIPPAMELRLVPGIWHRIPNFSRTNYEPVAVVFELKKNKAVNMTVFGDILLISTDSARHDVKIYCDDRKNEGPKVQITEKKNFTIITFPDLPTIKARRKVYAEVIGIHPEGYKETITFTAPEDLKTTMDSAIDDIVNNANVVSATYLDTKLGYPLKETNKETMVEKQMNKTIEKIRAENPTFQLTDVGYDEFNNEARRKIDRDLKWSYSYQKYFKIKKKVTQGKLPYNDWLDSRFLQKDNDDVAFLKAYGAGNNGELRDGFGIALAKHFGDTLTINNIADPLEINSKGKTLFWTCTFPSTPVKDVTSLLVFYFVYDTAFKKWDSYKTVFPKYVPTQEQTYDIKILKHSIGEQEYDNITADFVVITSDSGKYFIGNNQLYNTNFIKVADTFASAKNYKVLIKGVSLKDVKLAYSDIVSSEADGDVVGLKYITADKRYYQSTLLFEDLNGDDINEAFLITVSLGKLIDARVITITDKGVKEIPADDTWKAKIKETDFFKKLAKESSLSSSSFQK